ncbi:hypothetical protein B4U80_13484, partial [Leptotrombidium deliense]
DDSRNIHNLATIDRKCERRHKIGTVCESDFILPNVTYEQTGHYSCFYNDTGFEYDEDTWDVLYIFVNDDKNLLVPFEGRSYIVSHMTEMYPATIPCLPTNSKARVTLEYTMTEDRKPCSDICTELKVGEKYGVEYDPTIGFDIKSPKNDGRSDILRCIATLDEKVQSFDVNIFWQRKPKFALHPVINEDDAQNIYPNSTFSLVCGVIIEVGDVIRLDWNYPASAFGRVSESKLISSAIDDIILFSSKRLSVREAQPTDAGVYKCCVSNWVQLKYCSNKTVTVKDKRLPSHVNVNSDIPNLTAVLHDIGEGYSLNACPKEAVEREYFTLTCNVSQFVYSNITWFVRKNNFTQMVSLHNSENMVIKYSVSELSHISELHFTSLALSDSGSYYCNASSLNKILSQDHSEEYVLKVLTEQEPRILRTNLNGQLIEAEPSTMIHFYCLVDGRPKPKIVWYKNNKPLNTTIVSGIDLEDSGQKLVIRRLVANDSGRYECLVSNRLKILIKYAIINLNREKNTCFWSWWW